MGRGIADLSRLRSGSICDWACAGIVIALIAAAGGCSSPARLNLLSSSPSSTRPADAPQQPPDTWRQVSETLGNSGELRNGVYTVVVPRDDLSVSIEGMDVPTAAGIASTFRFYQCPCGKTVVLGEFVVADYEANDVAYALQKQDLLISSIGPYLLYEKPRLMVVRFQAEGIAHDLAQAIRSALNWTGKNRLAPQTQPPSM